MDHGIPKGAVTRDYRIARFVRNLAGVLPKICRCGICMPAF